MDLKTRSNDELDAVVAVLDKWIDRAQGNRLVVTASSPGQPLDIHEGVPDDRWDRAHEFFEQLWREVNAEISRRLRGERE
jgi:hypothetical protein